VIAHPAFRDGLVSTRFIPDHAADLAPRIPEIARQIAALLASAPRTRAGGGGAPRVPSVWDALGTWGRS
jgi:hypothetical protein